MKKLPLLLLLIISLGACRKHVHTPQPVFTDNIKLSTTPIKNQKEWPCGWIYATLSLIESERILLGDSLELSPTYLIRKLCDEAIKDGGLQLNGSPAYCFTLLEKQGILPYAFYRQELFTTADDFRQIYNANKRHDDLLRHVLDTIFEYVPSVTSLYGSIYTPHDMMRSVLIENSYEFISPLRTDSLPGDRQRENYTFINAEHLNRTIKSTLESGHSLVWYGDTLQAGYSTAEGIAICKDGNDSAHDLPLQRLHALHIFGLATSEHPVASTDSSKYFYIAKDSHGTDNKRNGLIYVSEQFVRHHTLAIYRLNPHYKP